MTLIDANTWEYSVCEKHNFKGEYCPQCIEEIKEIYALQKAIDILKSLKTSKWSRDTNGNFRLLWLTKLTELETQLEKLQK